MAASYRKAAEPLYLAARPREATAEARDWLLDAFGPDARNEIRLLNAVGIVAAVERHYEGGWQQFLLDSDNTKGTA